MIFKRSVQRYGRTPEPETPFQRAGQLWEERIGSARVRACNWRWMAFGTLGLSAGLATAFAWQSAQSRVVPYVVEVDKLGAIRAVEPAAAWHKASDPEIVWHLSEFIRHVRTVSLDPVLMRRDWLTAYDFLTPRGAVFLGTYARQARPFDAIGEQTVSVQVTSVVRASERSFQVKWTETTYARGDEDGTSRWTAILGIKMRPPSDAETLRKNPLGIYVDAIDWSRELDGSPATCARPTPTRFDTAPSRRPARSSRSRCFRGDRSMIAHRFPSPLLAASVVALPSNTAPQSRPAGVTRAVETTSVRTFVFVESATYTVPTAPGRVTDIALEPGETLGAVASGDTARWVIGDTTSGAGDDVRAHVLVKPVEAGLSTNLVITTNRRVYHLILSAAAAAPRPSQYHGAIPPMRCWRCDQV